MRGTGRRLTDPLGCRALCVVCCCVRCSVTKFTFLSGTHPRLGAQSSIRGRGFLSNPIFDPNVVPLILAFVDDPDDTDVSDEEQVDEHADTGSSRGVRSEYI